MNTSVRRVARRFLPVLALLVSAACADNTFTGPIAPEQPYAMGVGVHGTPAPVIAKLKELGIKWVRLTYYYQTVGDTAWDQMIARDLDTLSANGFSIDLVIHSTPWNDPDGEGIPHAVANLMRAHPGAIDAVELYNEENVGVDYWRPVLPGANDFERGQAYAPRYKAMRDTVQAFIPLLRVPVVTGGTAGDPEQFLRGIKAGGVTPDIVAIHCYGFPPFVQLDQFTKTSRRIFPGVPVWATEVGSEGGRTDPATRALDVAGVFAWMRRYPDVRAFWYVAWGDPSDAILDQNTFQVTPGYSDFVKNGPYR